MIWATSQYVETTTKITNKAIFTDPVLFGSEVAGLIDLPISAGGCGLHYDSTNTRWKFGIKCDKTAGTALTAKVDYDVAIHTYIMGFHFAADTKSVESELAVQAEYTDFTAGTPPVNKYELAFYDAGATGNQDRKLINDQWVTGLRGAPYAIKFEYTTDKGGPKYEIDTQNDELKGIKLAIVLSVVNPLTLTGVADNGFGAANLGYSYSGLYQAIDPTDYNIKSLIEDNKLNKYNNLHERIPAVKYAIYGFSSFKLKDGSGCTSFSLDLTLEGVNALTVSTNQKDSLSQVVIQSDQYFPQTKAVCAPGLEFSKLAV